MQRLTARQLFLAFLKLGLTAFGGPVAHLGYFRDEFVSRRRCLSEQAYADLVALCQFLPGPASSQVGISIGFSQAGLRGGLAAWSGFTLPSALAMMAFAYGVTGLHAAVVESGWLHGLKVVAVAVVAHAILGMGRTLCPDLPRMIIAGLAALLALFLPGVAGQVAAILFGAGCGLRFLGVRADPGGPAQRPLFGRRRAAICLVSFSILLAVLPLLAVSGLHTLELLDSFYRSGALVFGGGHVVLPLLQAEVVPPGWISKDLFLAGYGAAQAVPGPLFTFSAFLGTAMTLAPHGWIGGLLCLLAIYLPSFLLVGGLLPFWEDLRGNRRIQSGLTGINAAVVGLLLAAFIDPVWTSGIRTAGDLLLGLVAFLLLHFGKVPPWAVVLLTGLGGAIVLLLPF